MPPLIIYPNGAKISGRDKSLPYRAAKSRGGIHASLNRFPDGAKLRRGGINPSPTGRRKKIRGGKMPPLQSVGVFFLHRSSRK